MEEKRLVEVRVYDGGDTKHVFTERIESVSIKCPYCHTTVMPFYMLLTAVNDHRYNAFCQCTNCDETFILEYERTRMTQFGFKQLHPNPTLERRDFSEIINSISPSFADIYNQAYGAYQLNLNHICGMGYRKALEFLIKDYTIQKRPDAEEAIKKALLGACINNYVTDVRIKEIANRATWLGNDETHFERVYDDRDITDLLALIDLTIFWIEAEERTKRYNEEIQKRNRT